MPPTPLDLLEPLSVHSGEVGCDNTALLRATYTTNPSAVEWTVRNSNRPQWPQTQTHTFLEVRREPSRVRIAYGDLGLKWLYGSILGYHSKELVFHRLIAVDGLPLSGQVRFPLYSSHPREASTCSMNHDI